VLQELAGHFVLDNEINSNKLESAQVSEQKSKENFLKRNPIDLVTSK